MIFGDKKKVIAAANPLIGVTSVKGADTAVTLTIPAGNAGDQLLVFVSDSGAVYSGYTAVQASGSFSMNLAMHYKTAAGGEGSLSVGNGGLSFAGIIGVCVRIRGATTMDNIISNVGDWVPTSPHLGPGVITTVANEMEFIAAMVQGSAATVDALGNGYTELYRDFAPNNGGDATRNVSIVVGMKTKAVAGTDSQFNISWGASGATAQSFTSIGFGLK
jgi:hypothetical protein